MDGFQFGRDDHRCSLIGVEAHFDGICDVPGSWFLLGIESTVVYISRESPAGLASLAGLQV